MNISNKINRINKYPYAISLLLIKLMPNELPIHAITKHKSYHLVQFSVLSIPPLGRRFCVHGKEIRDSPVTCLTVISIKIEGIGTMESLGSIDPLQINTLRERLKAEEIKSMKI
jgi:hypothetical protein